FNLFLFNISFILYIIMFICTSRHTLPILKNKIYTLFLSLSTTFKIFIFSFFNANGKFKQGCKKCSNFRLLVQDIQDDYYIYKLSLTGVDTRKIITKDLF